MTERTGGMIEFLSEFWWLIVAVLLLGAVFAVFLVRRHRNPERQLSRAMRAISYELLRDIVIPDGMGGEIHIDYLMLNEHGLLVVDLKDVEGAIFGSDRMDEWAVINGDRRFTFKNPQAALYDRVAAVKLIVGEVPVTGRIVFTERGGFPKGRPKAVTMLGTLETEFRVPGASQDSRALAAFYPQWERIKREIVPAAD